MAIGSGDLLPGVAENPTFPILSALAYATGLGYRPTCDTRALPVAAAIINREQLPSELKGRLKHSVEMQRYEIIAS